MWVKITFYFHVFQILEWFTLHIIISSNICFDYVIKDLAYDIIGLFCVFGFKLNRVWLLFLYHESKDCFTYEYIDSEIVGLFRYGFLDI